VLDQAPPGYAPSPMAATGPTRAGLIGRPPTTSGKVRRRRHRECAPNSAALKNHCCSQIDNDGNEVVEHGTGPAPKLPGHQRAANGNDNALPRNAGFRPATTGNFSQCRLALVNEQLPADQAADRRPSCPPATLGEGTCVSPGL